MSKKLSNNTLSAFATALLCTVWMVIANATGLLGWAGFAGCTAYFAGPKKGVSALPLTFACVGSGVAYALISVHLGSQIDFAQIGLVFTFVTTFLMCAGGKIGIISFVPGAFMGSFSTFAAGGDFMIIPSIAAGIILGLCCDTLGKKLCATFGSEE